MARKPRGLDGAGYKEILEDDVFSEVEQWALNRVFGKWFVVGIGPDYSREHIVLLRQGPGKWHAFYTEEATGSGATPALALNHGLGDVIDTDAQLRAYHKLVLDAPTELSATYRGLQAAQRQAWNEMSTHNPLRPIPKLDAFTRGYIEGALWASSDESNPEGGEPMDQNYTIDDIHPDTLGQMMSDAMDFQHAHENDLVGVDTHRAGVDFWLTRNGHGAGFWDGDYEDDIGRRLTDAAHVYGSFDLYIGDDGQVHGA